MLAAVARQLGGQQQPQEAVPPEAAGEPSGGEPEAAGPAAPDAVEAVGERIPRSQSEGSSGPPPAEEAAEGLAAGLAGGLGTPQRTGSMPAKVVWSGPPRHASRPRLPTKDREVEAAELAAASVAAERASLMQESTKGGRPPLPLPLSRDIERFSIRGTAQHHFRQKKTKGFLGIFGRRCASPSVHCGPLHDPESGLTAGWCLCTHRHLTSEELAAHTDACIDGPLLAETPKSLASQAIENFRNIQRWMDEPEARAAGSGVSGGSCAARPGGAGGAGAVGALAWGPEQIAAATQVLRRAAGAVALTDEIYCQLCKQTATNPSRARRCRGLGLLLLLACVQRPNDPEICASCIRMVSRMLQVRIDACPSPASQP